jgi:hypothetical protein
VASILASVPVYGGRFVLRISAILSGLGPYLIIVKSECVSAPEMLDFLAMQSSLNSSRTLLIIDDRRLRGEAFAHAEKFIGKIDRLEAAMQSFRDHDQKLFNNWYELTFRSEKVAVEKFKEEFRSLIRFHNWVVATARLQGISMPEAYWLMDKERERYARGDAETRRLIDETRRARERAIREDMEREAREEQEAEQASRFSLEDIREMSEIKLNKLCSDPETAFDLLEQTLERSRARRDFEAFLRVWKAVPPRIQREFARAFKEDKGISLYEIIEKVEAALKADQEASIEESDGESDSPQGEFKLDNSEAGASAASAPRLEERLKLMYRKLVRRLHPDLHGEMQPWQKKIWDRAQKAYSDKDHGAIDRLYRLTMLRLRELSDLTMSEIHESYSWLKNEFSELEREAKNLKRLPAWGFAKRKTYEPLTKKILKDFDREIDIIKDEIEGVQMEHELLESLYHAGAYDEGPRVRQRSRGPRGARRGRDSGRSADRF